MQEVETFIVRHKNTFVQFTVTSTIMDLCLVAIRCPGAWVLKWWWDQEGLDMTGYSSTCPLFLCVLSFEGTTKQAQNYLIQNLKVFNFEQPSTQFNL